MQFGDVVAVTDLSYCVYPGKTLAIVGESGAGKSVSCHALMGLLPPRAAVSGSVKLRGRQLIGLDEREMRPLRGKDIALIFQGSGSSLNPIMRIGSQIAETARAHHPLTWRAANRYALELLRSVRMPAPEVQIDAYPHQLSGGMQQRVMIAIAL